MIQLQNFGKRISTGPVVLFLGQNYLKLDTNTDPLLLDIQSKFGGEVSTGPHYNLILESAAKHSNNEALAWISERCRHIPAPEWLKVVANFGWNSIFSSAIDNIWMSEFRNEWRDVAPIFDEQYFPPDPRNRHSMHCTFLFGCVDQTDLEARPPLSQLDFLKRKPVAMNLARRLIMVSDVNNGHETYHTATRPA